MHKDNGHMHLDVKAAVMQSHEHLTLELLNILRPNILLLQTPQVPPHHSRYLQHMLKCVAHPCVAQVKSGHDVVSNHISVAHNSRVNTFGTLQALSIM